MRTTFEKNLQLFHVPIEELQINEQSRDDIPRLLSGLKALYCDEQSRQAVLAHMEAKHSERASLENGRPGMSFWQVLVLGILKQGLNCDFDRLEEMCRHAEIRIMLQCPDYHDQFKSPRIAYNLTELLDEDTLRFVNNKIMQLGHRIVKHRGPVDVKADSFVVETDVEHPVDHRLLSEAVGCAVRETGRLCARRNIKGWRQHKHLKAKLGNRSSRLARRLRRTSVDSSAQVRDLLEQSASLIKRVRETLLDLPEPVLAAERPAVGAIWRYCAMAAKLSGHVRTRLIDGDLVPHGDKIFSVHEPHTRWISKGKAGRPVELGVPVSIAVDRLGYKLDWEIQWTGGDRESIIPLAERIRAQFGRIGVFSLDKGHWSPGILAALGDIAEMPVMNKKGRRGKADREREAAPGYAEARRAHSAVESAINELEHKGLDRVLSYGADGFARMTGLAVCAANIQKIGTTINAWRCKGRGPPPLPA